ncbi:MAG: hemin uptake protein HemP [Rhodocyclaceae bacterium]|nr:hemin uptake protein HemP [Rhodocyclaceae bacterium]
METAFHSSPAHSVAGALSHLARHMETGCPQAAELAIVLLEHVATDLDADAHLRAHAQELADVLDRDNQRDSPAKASTGTSMNVSTPLQSTELFRQENSVRIVHNDHIYQLRVTRENKLILTKP